MKGDIESKYEDKYPTSTIILMVGPVGKYSFCYGLGLTSEGGPASIVSLGRLVRCLKVSGVGLDELLATLGCQGQASLLGEHCHNR